MFYILIIAGVAAIATLLRSRHRQQWINGLRCQKCDESLTENLPRADRLNLEVMRAVIRAYTKVGFRVNPAKPPFRFPCENCGTIYRIIDFQTCNVDESQEFVWPDPDKATLDAEATCRRLLSDSE